jgi:CBS domain-containing protein
MAATVRDVYVPQIVRANAHTMLADVERSLLAASSDEVYIVSENGQLLGLVPDYELLKLRMLNLLDAAAAIDVMTPCPHAIRLDAPLEEAARHLRVHVHRSLPVIDNGRLVGRIDRRSILNWYSTHALSGQPATASSDRLPPARPKFLDAVTASPAVRRV